MLYVAMLLVAGGLAAVTVALVAARARVAGMPPAVPGPVGEVPVPGEPASAPLLYRAGEPVFLAAAGLVRRLSPGSASETRRRRLLYAGLEARLPVERLLGYKAAAAVGGLLVGLIALPVLSGVPFWLVLGFPTVFGYLIPDALLAGRAEDRQKRIGRDLPEAIDLLAITVEAGLGLEQAIQVVTENMPGPLGDELNRLLREIELGVSRREALAALRGRVDVDELSAFVVSLIQADRMGVAVADVLKVQAAQVRLKRRQKAREAAAKTPVKILFPVIFGILPALFVVTLGPAAITIIQQFGSR